MSLTDFLNRLIPRRDGLPRPVLSVSGHCPTCDSDVEFIARNDWLRDHLLCSQCGSIPRERALMQVIESRFPNWRDLVVHESSPSSRGASLRLKNHCTRYVPSHFYPDVARGGMTDGFRCENLESLTFDDESIDIHVTQDVMEHVFNPANVFREIARTLKPGGAHIFTVPLVNKNKPSSRRASRDEAGAVTHIASPVFHGNPISEEGSLVTMDWGFDIARHIFEASGLFTQIVFIDDLSRGIRAEYIEVLLTTKPER